MKKLLLFIAIALAASGLAQQRNDAGVPYLGTVTATEGNPWSTHANAPQRGPQRDPQKGLAYYYRPQGAFFQGINIANPADVLNNSPMVMRPYSIATYKARQAKSYEWTYQQDGSWYTSTGNQNLEVAYGCEIDSVPKLKIGAGNTYYPGEFINDNTPRLWSKILAVPDPIAYSEGISGGTKYFVSPKYLAFRSDDAYVNNPNSWFQEHPNGDTIYSSMFGRNHWGYDSISLWMERPIEKYLLRGICIVTNNTAMELNSRFLKLDVIVRRAEKNYATDSINPGVVLTKGVITIDTCHVRKERNDQELASGLPAMQGWNLAFDDPIEIESEIMITVTGYNNSDANIFFLMCPMDIWNEGFGDHCYIHHEEKGWRPMSTEWGFYIGNRDEWWSGYFTGGSLAPGIFMDVKFPYTMLCDEDDTGVRQVGGAGGRLAVELKSSDPGCEQQVTIESATPGNDDTSWLTVGFTDGETSELGEHSLTADLNVAPNTVGTPRSARVTITMPASPTVTLLVNQTNGMVADVTGDGQVDIADVNAVINVMLGKAEPIPAADVTGDGTVDIADVNAVINIMLGKNSSRRLL